MAKTNKKTKIKKSTNKFIIIDSDGEYVDEYPNYDEAAEVAKDECEIAEKTMIIIEVVRAWVVEAPEEPRPDILPLNIDNISDYF